MKHYLLSVANGLHTPPCSNSHGKSVHFFNFRFSLFTPLLVLFLLIVGNSPAWGECSFAQGETIYFRLNKDVNWSEANAYPAAVFYYSSDSRKDTKTNTTNWDNMSAACHIGSDNYTKLTIVDAGNKLYSVTIPRNDIGYIRIVRIAGDDANWTWNNQSKMSVTDAGTNNCIYCSGWDNTGTWETYNGGRTNTCIGGGDPEPIETNWSFHGDMWLNGTADDAGWVSGNNPNTPHFMDNGDGTAICSFIFPNAQCRLELYDNGNVKTSDRCDGTTNLTKSKFESNKYYFDATGDTKKYTFKINTSTGRFTASAEAYPVQKTGWHVFLSAGDGDPTEVGTITEEDGLVISNVSSGNHNLFITDGSDNTIAGVNWFGGLYIDKTNSNVAWATQREYYGDSKFSSTQFPIRGKRNATGRFKLEEASDIIVAFDGGKITINKVEDATPAVKYTVTLHPNNGGSEIVRENVPEGSNSSATELNLSEVTYGKGTATWYTDAACTTPFTTVTGNMHLYAKWGVSGNYYFVSSLQTASDAGETGNWNSGWAKQLNYTSGNPGKCSYSFIAPAGRLPFELLTSTSGWNSIGADNNLINNDASNVTVAVAVSEKHFYFELPEPKKVTISYDGKVSINVEDYNFDNTKTWHIKTSWASSGGGNWNYNTVLTNSTNGGSVVLPVEEGDYSFIISTKTNDNDAQQVVGTETFNALYVDTSNPSSGFNWRMTEAKLEGSGKFNKQLPQADGNYWRNCAFHVDANCDIRITFDGGYIRCDIVAPNIVTFKDGENTLSTQEVSNGGKAIQPTNPTKAGYTFVKWQLDGSDYDFSSAVTGNITLNAVWAYKGIESVSLNKSALTFFENSAPQTLTASYLPADVIGVTYNWSVAPAGVVNIDNDGVVSVVNPGTATITCTATDQEGNSRFATCAVTVHEGEGCVMEEQAIFSHTILGNSIMGGSASNTLPEQESLNAGMEPTCRKIKMYYDNLTSEFTADDNGIVKAKSGLSDNSDVWYEIKGGANSNAIDGNFYYLKNVKTGGYITRGEGQFGTNGDWYFYTTITSPTNEKTNLYQFIYTKKGNPAKDRICSVWEYSGMEAKETYGLHRRNQDWADNYKDHCPNPMIVFGRGENQGNSTLNVNFIVIEPNASNPDYLSTPIVYNTRSYYRFAQNAAVSMTLDKKLRADDKIVVYCYNPSNAARNGGLYINNNKVADISIPANSENIFEYVTVDADAGKNTIEVRSDDNHFCVASVEVLRSLPVAAQDPMLTWSAPANYYTRLAAGPFTFKASSAKSSGPITYISSDENVATVDADGTVTPKTNGTTIITTTIEQYLCFGESSIQYNVVVEPTLQEAIDATPVGRTLTLTHDYSENAVINKAITLDANGHTIGDLTVEYEGDLTLSGELTVRDFTIWAKAGNTEKAAASGQVRNASELKVNGNAYFLYTVDPSGHVQYGWYDFTVPFPINIVSGIKGIQDGVLKEDFRNGVDYAVMEYFGEKQAQGQYPYKKFSGVMQPKKLYTITLDDDYNYNTLRMQKTADGALVAGDEVTLNAHTEGDAINANWNGVGNGTLHHADADNLSAVYVQVYQSGSKNTFLPVNKNDYSFVVGTAFMVQQEGGTMMLNQATHGALLAPSRYESAPATAIQIASEGKPFSDQLFITASETGGQAYTPGVDVAKAGELGSANVPQIWTNAYNSSLCVHEAQLINGKAQYNLSIYAPVAGTYTLTSKNIPAGYSLYLTQNGMIVSELSDTYTLDLSKGITTEYGLLLTEIYNSPTGIENTQTDKTQTTKIIRNGVLYILHNGKVYNAQGAKVK